eukprot:741497-Alexandrium_andersonii.AAC.1
MSFRETLGWGSANSASGPALKYDEHEQPGASNFPLLPVCFVQEMLQTDCPGACVPAPQDPLVSRDLQQRTARRGQGSGGNKPSNRISLLAYSVRVRPRTGIDEHRSLD